MTINDRRSRSARILLAVLASFAVALAACGSEPIPISVPAAGESAAQPAGTNAAPVKTASSDFGDILTNAQGLSVYGFTDDVDGVSTCSGGCAGAWPPVLVDGSTTPAGLDASVFSVVTRDDGQQQLKAGKWPLYLFAGDTAPGQTSGHLSGDVWFLARPDGTLVGVEPAAPAVPAITGSADQDDSDAAPDPEASAAAPVSVGATSLGDVLVDAQGHTLYGFTNDADGESTCEGGCAEAWPPLLVPGSDVPAGLDATLFSVVTRPDGTNQLKAGVWPLYLFAGDTSPGQTTGHLSGDVWFAASPTGGLIDLPSAESSETAAAVDSEIVEESAEDGTGYGAQDAPTPAAATPVAIVTSGESPLGDVLVTDSGLTLYGFANDVAGTSTCDGGCADAWPPVLVPTSALPNDLDPATFSVTQRTDGSWQLKAGAWPLYRFAGDTATGQTSGHRSGNVWFAAAPNGKLIDFTPAAPAAPAATATAAPAPAPTAEPTPAPPAPTPTPTPVAGSGYGQGGSESSDY